MLHHLPHREGALRRGLRQGALCEPVACEAERLAISNSLSGMRRYSEMPLKILKAEELVGGEAAMDELLHGLFNRELDPMYPYLTYQEFLDACGLTEEDLTLD